MIRAARLRSTFADVQRALPVSPWAGPAVLTPIEITGLVDGVAAMTRAEAMAVPAVAGARHSLVSTIARLPLVAERDGQPIPVQPLWLDRRDKGAESPVMRMARTVDDLLFYGSSLWLRERDAEGHLIHAFHVPWEQWEYVDDGQYRIGDDLVPADRVIWIPGLHEGILTFGAATIRGAFRTMLAAVDTAEHPVRVEMHDTGDYPMTRAEQREVVAEARAAMASAGGVLFTTPGLETRLHPVDTGAMQVAGRESFAVDVARLVGIPSAVINAYAQGATMTYTTVQDVLNHFLNLGATLYMTPITDRLSFGDVCPRGQEIRFNVDALLGAAALAQPTPSEGP